MSLRGQRRSKVRFRDLSPGQQGVVAALGIVEVALLIAAQVDIQRRRDDQVVGRKAWWRAVCLINVIGPLSYFRWGRRSTTPLEPQTPRGASIRRLRVHAAPPPGARASSTPSGRPEG